MNRMRIKQKKGKYGFVDESGKWVIKPKFDEAGDFIEGFAAVALAGKYGYIKPDGSWLVEPKFDRQGFSVKDSPRWH